jgi:hypothetical protein
VQVGQAPSQAGQCGALVVVEDPLRPDDFAPLHHPVAAEGVVVRGDLAGYNGFAEAGGGLDDHAVLAAMDRVDGEQHSGLVAVHHLLDDDRHGDVVE